MMSRVAGERTTGLEGVAGQASSVRAQDAEGPAVLAADVGSSSVRAALFDARGREVEGASAQIVRDFRTSADGGAEESPEALLADAERALDAAHAKVAALAVEVGAVAVSCFWHSLVGVDRAGGAVTPVYGWADTRAVREVGRLRGQFDERAAHARTGCRFHTAYWPAKLLWLRAARPEIFGRVARWMSFGEFATERWCGGPAQASVSMASGTGLFDVRRLAWDEELLAGLGLSAGQLPPVASDDHVFKLTNEYAARWPALAGLPLFAPVGDGAANNVGAGCVTRGRVALMVGTSAAMRVMFEGEPPKDLPPALWCYRADSRRVIVGGALSDGGGLHEWMRETLRLAADAAEVEAELSAIGPDSHGLTVLPYWAGERSTGWDARARGAILGLRASTRPVEILRAAMEAVALRLAAIADTLEEFAPGAEVHASGGALRSSRVWTQIVADALGRAVLRSRAREASCRGAALLALERLGALKSLTDAPAPTYETFAPEWGAHARYREALARQEQLYNSVLRG
jgi:gluconokinase